MFENNTMCLNEFRKYMAANLGRCPLIHSYCYASAGDRPTLFAIFSPDLIHMDVMYASNAGAFTCPPFIQHAGEW
jgi:hypothetical protein